MQLYKITGEPAQFRAGAIVSLDDKQFAARAHNVEPGEKDGRRTVAIAKTEIWFKAGEVIGLGDVPRSLEAQLVAIDAPKPRDAGAGDKPKR